MALVYAVYDLTSRFPKHEIYGLTSQMRRAAVSIPSNIAEGEGRAGDRELSQFLCHARGSLHELETQLLIARHLGYVADPDGERIDNSAREVGRLLNGLIAYAAQMPESK